jgi:RNA polymerase sigma-B factor
MPPDLAVDLFVELRSGNDPARQAAIRDRLIIEHRWMAEHAAARFRNRGEPDADLRQVAMLGLLKATDRFDPSRGVPFHGYAVPTIVGELKRHFRDRTWAVGVPRRAKDLLPHLNNADDTLRQRHGRAPTVAELAGELGVDQDAVILALEARGANAVAALDADPAADLDVDIRVEVLAALRRLDERSREAVFLRFFTDCTQTEIGKRLGLGQVQVSRLLRAALRQLRDDGELC